MSLHDIILSTRNTRAAADLALQFALREEQVETVLCYLIPNYGDAVVRLMRTPSGLVALLGQIASSQHQIDTNAPDLFQNSRILANGTGLLSLLLRNEATIRVVAAYVAEGARVDEAIVRRMMPYVATMYIGALSLRARSPLEQLAARVDDATDPGGHGLRKLAQLVLHASSSPQTAAPLPAPQRRVSIKDILTALSRLDAEEEVSAATPKGKSR